MKILYGNQHLKDFHIIIWVLQLVILQVNLLRQEFSYKQLHHLCLMSLNLWTKLQCCILEHTFLHIFGRIFRNQQQVIGELIRSNQDAHFSFWKLHNPFFLYHLTTKIFRMRVYQNQQLVCWRFVFGNSSCLNQKRMFIGHLDFLRNSFRIKPCLKIGFLWLQLRCMLIIFGLESE